MKRLLITSLIIFLLVSINAAPYKIKYLTADEGLSRNLVNHIYRDSHGFMWFSTSYGLDRYDGYDFIHFNSRTGGNRLLSDYVHAVTEDSNGNLWIATENGINVIDYKTGKILNADDILTSDVKFQTSAITNIITDENGDVWVVFDKGLAQIRSDNGEYSTARMIYSDNLQITAFLKKGNEIYIGQEGVVYRIIKNNNNEYTRVNISSKLLNFPGFTNVIFDDNGTLWIGTSLGLFRYEPDSENFTSYFSGGIDNKNLSSNYITDIKKNNEGKLVVSTLIGINIYDYRTDSFQQITTEPNFSGVTLSNNFVSCVFINDNSIWVGTEKGGVNILTRDESIFNNIYHVPSEKNSISVNPVNSIYEDTDGDLWVGTVEGGLNLRRKSESGFRHFYANSADRNSLTHNSVSYICQDYNRDYWIATWGKGINRLRYKNKGNPVFEQFSNIPGVSNSLLNDFVAALAPDNITKSLWIGTRNGLDYYDITTGKFTHVLYYLPFEKKFKFITGMFIDSKRRLWVGTANGLFCIFLNKTDIKRNRVSYQHFRYELMSPSTKRILKINCILEAKDGRIWFGSNGNGLYSLVEKGNKYFFRNYNENTGLLDDVIYGLLEDASGALWLSTDKGLCALDPNMNHSRKFTKADGLRSNQFYWDAYCKTADGKMYFGNMSGLVMFDPLKLNTNTVQYAPVITRIKVLNEDVYPSNPKLGNRFFSFEKTQLAEIDLNESDKTFSVEFSALNYNMADKIKYAYRLKGFTNNWTEVSSDRRFANFTNISYGTYELEIKCTNSDGIWSDKVTRLTINIIPPFYKRWWFILLVIALGVFSVLRYYRYRINQLNRQKAQLKLLVDERTREIEQKKQQLEEQACQLKLSMSDLMLHQEEVSRQNEILKTQNQKITNQKEQLITLSKKVQEANIDKISFFTNITHEFRTPITLILGPVERSLKLSTNPLVLEQLHIVRRNSKLLLSLINQLMDFRKIDSGKMEIVKTQQNFITFLDELILPFEDLVKERGIRFVKQYRMNSPEFLFDKENMQKVIGNLLSNAVKFTPDQGTITVVASIYTDRSDHKERMYVAVKDTGNGVPEEELEKIFERFYQSKQNKTFAANGQSGTGIGLYLSKRIIQMHNGKIEARNQSGGGCSFRFIIPIERRLTMMVSDHGKADEMFVANSLIVDKEELDIQTKTKPILLVVEDNHDMRTYIRSILIQDFYIIESQNGAEGLEMTKRYQPELIISDIMMPVMDGIRFCKEVKSNFTTSHIPVILLTAKSGTDTQIESFNTGADAFLVKPFDEDLLKAIIQNLSEKRNRMQLNFSESMDSDALKFNNESPDKVFIDKALKIIKENYTDPDFDVTEFIEMMGISRSLLHKKLKNIAGQSASRFVRIYRLNIAREIIIKNRENHSLNISEIAYKVGFNDPKYFTRCFTKHFGIQPSIFLENAGEQH